MRHDHSPEGSSRKKKKTFYTDDCNFTNYKDVIRALGEKYIDLDYDPSNTEFINMMEGYIRWNEKTQRGPFGMKVFNEDVVFELGVFAKNVNQKYIPANWNRQYNPTSILCVKKSTLNDAGRGLFAAIQIPKNTTFSFYIGAVKNKNNQDKQRNNPYRFELRGEGKKQNKILDPIFHKKNNLHGSLFLGAHFINDKCLGNDSKACDGRIHYNAKFEGIFVVSTCEIRKGSEIFVSYNTDV